MILIEDTRQKVGKHENIARYCREKNIKIERRVLSVGDYMIDGIQNIAVDTKIGIEEVCMDLGAESARFRREMIRANKLGVSLIFLVEDSRFSSISDVVNWKNKNYAKTKLFMDGAELAKRMRNAVISYGCQFVFCKKSETGETLIKILKGEKKNGR